MTGKFKRYVGAGRHSNFGKDIEYLKTYFNDGTNKDIPETRIERFYHKWGRKWKERQMIRRVRKALESHFVIEGVWGGEE